MANTPKSNWRKFSRIAGTVVAAILLVFIAGMLFFKFVPSYGFYVVKSGSMEPSIKPGDIVFTHQAAEVHTGDVITFENKDEIVTHRIISINGSLITTQGDANKVADATPITIKDIKGTYLFKVPAIGYIINLTNNRSGWFLIVIIPTIILVLFICKDILKEAFKDDKKGSKAGKGEPQNTGESPVNTVTPSAVTQEAAAATPIVPVKKVNIEKSTSPKSNSRNWLLTIKKIVFIEKF
jgi:signal peptidase I